MGPTTPEFSPAATEVATIPSRKPSLISQAIARFNGWRNSFASNIAEAQTPTWTGPKMPRRPLLQAGAVIGLAASLGIAGGASAQEILPPPPGEVNPPPVLGPDQSQVLGLVDANGNVVAPSEAPVEAAGVLLAPERMVAGGLEINNFVPGGHGVIYDAQAESIIAETVGNRKIIINVTQTDQPLEGYWGGDNDGKRSPTHSWLELRAPELILPPGSTVNGITYPNEITEGSVPYGKATMDIRPDGALVINYNFGTNYENFVNGPLPNLPTPDTAEFAQRRRDWASSELSSYVMNYLQFGGLRLSWPTVPGGKGIEKTAPVSEDLEVFVKPNPLLQLV